ncbi:RNA-directed DNA polymerase, eukaryota, reverse transcriptase zinc-binding domain protein [Tanacetum coccineum]|uniref:RNA-directed DNA polymerase, eukaryota, reverse transcriptase zinc-binding domain protein n=1 Tax=Tanacetum coccineum TaxID=301880 RepID=A0ABQ5G6F8_9ASTR
MYSCRMEEIVRHDIVGDKIVDDGVPKERVKRTNESGDLPLEDLWEFTGCASRKYSVKAFRNNLHKLYKRIPIKINIFSWRVANERLPSRVNLDRIEIDFHSVRCPVCDDDLEIGNHIFVHCATSKQMWTDILKWWNLHNLIPSIFFEAITLADRANLTSTLTYLLDGVIQSAI